jgi:hypothetical protein
MKMAGKSTILFFTMMFLVFGPAPTMAADAPELVCGEIPFGKSLAAVLAIYGDVEMVQEESPYIESIGNYALEKYFQGGLKKDESGICFLPKIVEKYTITHRDWKDCDSMTLYFGAFEKEPAVYTLFMVKRTRPKPPEDGDFKQIFDSLSREMDRLTGTRHSVDQGRVQSFDQQSHTFYLPALVGIWDAGDTLVFVMVANSPDGPLPPEEVFVSKPGLKRYLEICKTY